MKQTKEELVNRNEKLTARSNSKDIGSDERSRILKAVAKNVRKISKIKQ